MDLAHQEAIAACGTCGRPEREHQAASDETEQLDILAVLGAPVGGACAHFTASPAALTYAKHLQIANKRPGRTLLPICQRCGNRGHGKSSCPL